LKKEWEKTGAPEVRGAVITFQDQIIASSWPRPRAAKVATAMRREDLFMVMTFSVNYATLN